MTGNGKGGSTRARTSNLIPNSATVTATAGNSVGVLGRTGKLFAVPVVRLLGGAVVLFCCNRRSVINPDRFGNGISMTYVISDNPKCSEFKTVF